MDGLKRNVQSKINDLLTRVPVVAILGARQVGKSTLARQIGNDWKYYDLENHAHFDLINNDPVLFFKENNQKVILDEAQQSPELFKTLRGVIDQERKINNRFILTGSASFELMKHISESLAGRIAIIELSSIKMNELRQEPLSSFFNIFEEKVSKKDLSLLKNLKSIRSISEIKQHLLRGGYPDPAIKNDKEFHLDWMENYFNTYINRDMRSLFPGIDLLKYQRVIKMLSSLSGTIINKSEVARSSETSENQYVTTLKLFQEHFFGESCPLTKLQK